VLFPTWTCWSEDIVFYLDLVQHTRVGIVDRPLVVYRKHSEAQTAKPEMRQQRDESLRKWLEINQDQIPKGELAELITALKRREKWSLLSLALVHRRENKPMAALALYMRVLLRSLYTPSSPRIVSSGLRSSIGAVAETIRARRHPV
jgi:hypothetical protein